MVPLVKPCVVEAAERVFMELIVTDELPPLKLDEMPGAICVVVDITFASVDVADIVVDDTSGPLENEDAPLTPAKRSVCAPSMKPYSWL